MDWRQSLAACWNSVAVQLPQLQESLSHLGQSLGLGSFTADAAGGSAAGQVYELRGRRLRVVRQLGEGGYSFVYLVRQLAAVGGSGTANGDGAPGSGRGLLASSELGTQLFALKRVLCGSEEQLREAEHEVAVMRRPGLRHPCLLPLLDAETQLQRAPDGTMRHVVLMLFPVYDEGNLFDFVQQQQAQQARLQRGQPSAARRVAVHHQLVDLLRIFLQVCTALHAMHTQEPALAHRDVKPQNVVLRRQQQQQQGQQPKDGRGPSAGASSASSSEGLAGGAYDPMPPLAPPEEGQILQRQSGPPGPEQGWAAQGWGSTGEGGSSGSYGSGTAAGAAPGAPAEIAVEPEGRQRRLQEEAQWWAARLPGWRQEHEAVLMDFGSTRAAVVEVRGRMEAMAVQEDAERQCTAPYRAPELWDVASSCTIDERVDVWSLGCLLYFMLCGQSPFERAAGEAGGSLMLAVVNGRLTWPQDIAADLPESVKDLVGRCLDTDPSARPRVAEVAAQADGILASLQM